MSAVSNKLFKLNEFIVSFLDRFSHPCFTEPRTTKHEFVDGDLSFGIEADYEKEVVILYTEEYGERHRHLIMSRKFLTDNFHSLLTVMEPFVIKYEQKVQSVYKTTKMETDTESSPYDLMDVYRKLAEARNKNNTSFSLESLISGFATFLEHSKENQREGNSGPHTPDNRTK